MKGQIVVFTKKDPKGPRFSTIFLSLKLTKNCLLVWFLTLSCDFCCFVLSVRTQAKGDVYKEIFFICSVYIVWKKF